MDRERAWESYQISMLPLVYFIYNKEHGTANMSKMNVGYKNRLFSKIPTLVTSGNAYIPLVDVISYIY